MSARTIFAAQQELVGKWAEEVSNHEAALGLLRQNLERAEPRAGLLDNVSRGPGIVGVQTVAKPVEDVLAIFDSVRDTRSDADKGAEVCHKVLSVLTFLIDEVLCLRRRIDDDDPSVVLEAKFVCRRLTNLLCNLVKQGIALVRTRLVFEGRLEKVKLFWIALSDGLGALLALSKKSNVRDDELVRHILEALGKDVQDLPQTEKLAWADIACNKVLKPWCDAALTVWDVLRCASLYLVIHRVGYKPSWTPLNRVYALGSKISSLLPIFTGRRCVKLEEYIFRNVEPLPSYASSLNQDFSIQRKNMANTMASNIEDYSKRLAHELVFRQNLQVGEKIRHLIICLLYSHVTEKIPLPKHALRPLLLMMESLVACEQILFQTPPIIPTDIVLPTTATDVPIVNKLLKGARTLSPARAVALSLALSSSKQDSLNDITLQSELELVRNLRRCCEVSSLFSPFSELFEPLVKLVVEGDLLQLSSRLPVVVRSFQSEDTVAINRTERVLTEWVVDFLYEEIDQMLRSRLVMKDTTDTSLTSLSQRQLEIQCALECPLLDLSGVGSFQFSVKSRVKQRLESTWHEMRCTGIDRTWETYAEMQVLAKDYFGLDVFLDPLAPASSAVSGCDVLDIARDVGAFCEKYNYNMNQEFFIEKRPHGKYVNLVTVDSLYRSVRAHGAGILSSVVNIVYRFLAMRFEHFSQSLFDEHVKSFLKRERRWMAREQVSTAGASYPFERAADFAQNVKTLNFLQKTRTIVTEIGNALGLVRNVRAGALKWAGSVHRFVPVNGGDIDFNGQGDEDSRLLAKHLGDVALKQVPDYLHVLIDVFRKVESSKNEHLKNAFMVIPALCVDFVDSCLFAKDQVARIHKNPNRDAYFTDDGFVLGVAAILAMLNQDLHFDSLKFFKGVAAFFEATSSTNEASATLESFSKSGDELDKGDTVIGLSKRRHRGAAREYELLMYGLSGARVFFKRGTANDKEPKQPSTGAPTED